MIASLVLESALDVTAIPSYLSARGFGTITMAGIFATLLMMFIFSVAFIMAKSPQMGFMMDVLVFFCAIGWGWIDGWIAMMMTFSIVVLFVYGGLGKLFKG